MGSTWSCKRGRELPWLQPRLFYAHASTSTFLVKILFLCPLLPVCVFFMPSPRAVPKRGGGG